MSLTARSEIVTQPHGDPVTLEILKNALESLADEMALIILRSAYSPIVRDSMDYSTAICDHKGRIIAQGLTNPIHLGSFPRIMQTLTERFGSAIAEGDGFLVNDPYDAGGMHLPDIFFIRPVHLDGVLVGFTSALVHHTDIGGMAPGSMALNAEELFQEGLRIPIVRLYEAGRENRAVFDLLKANSRMPEEVMGDLRAQISACDTVGRSLKSLAAKHGAAFPALVEELHDYSERLVRQRIATMPDGVVNGEDFIDGLGADGEPIRFSVAITISGSEIGFDWSGTSDQVAGAINCPITTTWSLAYAALRTVLGPGIPNCEGYMRPVKMTAPLGSIVNPRPYAACAARGVIAYRMLDTCFSAFGKLMPGLVPAGGEGGPTAVTFSGYHAGTHARWLVTDGILGSWGGRAAHDGVEGISNPGANLSNQPIELMEARLPLRIREYGYAANSGGAGRTRGGAAMIRSYVIESEDAAMTLRSDRRRYLPLPIEDGMPGSPSLTILEHPDGSRALLATMKMGEQPLKRGDVVVHIAAGGAGYGDPLQRPAETVLRDIEDGHIDNAFARDVYGVVLNSCGLVDVDATELQRRKLAEMDRPQRIALQQGHFLEAMNATELLKVGN
ncbi:hydantoinase B/oxoprolinase family protein [Martelella soudanensis]|uniref:hydantoinase B/oxoprolinase family protein n=1 Tax=unclassified Martelella TaxID=2629616 RepID=UPI0015DF0FF8|nr:MULTISPECIES: hydantoinase B/oxoprolinase family protein [unclassified Martelella]